MRLISLSSFKKKLVSSLYSDYGFFTWLRFVIANKTPLTNNETIITFTKLFFIPLFSLSLPFTDYSLQIILYLQMNFWFPLFSFLHRKHYFQNQLSDQMKTNLIFSFKLNVFTNLFLNFVVYRDKEFLMKRIFR